MPTLHVRLDESGHLTFAPKKSRFYVFAAAWTYDPLPLAAALWAIRFGANKAGDDICGFHANADPPPRRALVLQALNADKSWKYTAAVVEKNKVYKALYKPEVFYPRFANMPLRFILEHRLQPGTTQVMVYLGLMPVLR